MGFIQRVKDKVAESLTEPRVARLPRHALPPPASEDGMLYLPIPEHAADRLVGLGVSRPHGVFDFLPVLCRDLEQARADAFDHYGDEGRVLVVDMGKVPGAAAWRENGSGRVVAWSSIPPEAFAAAPKPAGGNASRVLTAIGRGSTFPSRTEG